MGIIGGAISSKSGSGMDIFSFSVMVLLFGICEKVSTPTSVILMACNAVVGFIKKLKTIETLNKTLNKKTPSSSVKIRRE